MRVPELRPETMTDEQRAVMQEIVSGPHQRIVGPYFAWLHSPELARRARNLSEFIRFKSSLPPRLSELTILITGKHWSAEFEFYAHAILGKKAGLDDGVISALAAGRRPKFKLEGERVVYDLVSELLATARVREATYARAVQALGLAAVVEVVATSGYYSMVSLTLNTFQVPLPEGEPSPFPKKAKPAAAAKKAKPIIKKKAAKAAARPISKAKPAKKKDKKGKKDKKKKKSKKK